MATGGEDFPTKKSDSTGDDTDHTSMPPPLEHGEQRGAEELAAFQLQRELARMQMQFQKEVYLFIYDRTLF